MKSNILCCQKLFPRESENRKVYNAEEMKMPILEFYTLKSCVHKQPVVRHCVLSLLTIIKNIKFRNPILLSMVNEL